MLEKLCADQLAFLSSDFAQLGTCTFLKLSHPTDLSAECLKAQLRSTTGKSNNLRTGSELVILIFNR